MIRITSLSFLFPNTLQLGQRTQSKALRKGRATAEVRLHRVISNEDWESTQSIKIICSKNSGS